MEVWLVIVFTYLVTESTYDFTDMKTREKKIKTVEMIVSTPG